MQSTIETALGNVMRKKGKQYRKLFKKKKQKNPEMPISRKEAKKLKEAFKENFLKLKNRGRSRG